MKPILLFVLVASSVFATDYVNGTILLTDANKPAYLANSGTGTSIYTAAMAGASGDKFKFCASLIKAQCTPATLAGLATSCPDPCTISMQRNWGQQYYMYEEVSSGGTSLSPRKISAWQTAPQVPLTCASSWTLPIEVIGQDMYTNCVNVTLTSPPSTGVVLEFRVNNAMLHLPPYDGKMSVQINGGAWLPITNSTATIIDESKWLNNPYDIDQSGSYADQTIGGPVATFRAWIAVPNSTLLNGTNTVNWRFNGTDGFTSGYRILELHFLDTATKVSMTQIAVSSNVATATTSASHGFSSSNDVYLWEAPGMAGLFNGSRNITVASGTTFTFTPCGSGLGFYAISGACTSPDGTYTVPTTYATTGDKSTFPQLVQPVMYVAHQLDPQSQYSYQDPSTFTAPAGGDSTTGGTLFSSGTLALPNSPFMNGSSHAHCADCHSANGNDLSYFRYSNQAIEQRALFHGMSWQNALDITAYIRSLDSSEATNTNARPWNPLQQPGPGISSLTTDQWDGGCGIDCVLTYDQDLYPFLSTNGAWSNIGPTNNVKMTDTPLMYQLVDWNHMLPMIWPDDYFGTSFDWTSRAPNYGWISTPSGLGWRNSFVYKYYQAAATALVGHTTLSAYEDFDTFASSTYAWTQLKGLAQNLPSPCTGTGCASTYSPYFDNAPIQVTPSLYTDAFYSIGQFVNTKFFELLHDGGYEGVGSSKMTALYGASTSGYYNLGWTLNASAFFQAPHQLQMSKVYTPYFNYPATARQGTTQPPWDYLSNQLYFWTAVQDCGNREAQPAGIIDWNYYPLFAETSGQYRPNAYHMNLTWINAMQCGWDAANSDPTGGGSVSVSLYLPLRFGFSGLTGLTGLSYKFSSPTQITELAEQQATQTLALLNHWSASTIANVFAENGAAACSLATGISGSHNYPDFQQGTGVGCNSFRWELPLWKYYGVDSTTLGNIVTKLSAIWPTHNFTNDLNATCTLGTNSGFQWPLCNYP